MRTERLRSRRGKAICCRAGKDCESGLGQLHRIDRMMQLNGFVGADQHQRPLEIAELSPVHRTLHAQVDVRTTLVSTKGIETR